MKKLLTVLCLALLLTVVCSSAMAAVVLKSNGKDISTITPGSMYGGNFVVAVNVLEMPRCTTTGLAEIVTTLGLYDETTGTYTNTGNPGPTSNIVLDAVHNYDGLDNDGWRDIETTGTAYTQDCTKKVQKRVCVACGYTETREVSTGVNHQFEAKHVPGHVATCQEPGLMQSVCVVCGAINPAQPNPWETPKAPHSYSKEVVDKAETCDFPGKHHYVCEWCGEPEKDDNGKVKYLEIPAHAFQPASVRVVDQPATCFAPGAEHEVCALCGLPARDGSGNIISIAIPQLQHQYGEWVVKTAPSCQPGLEQRICPLCGDTDTRPIPATNRHAMVTFFKNPGNCTRNSAGLALPATLTKYEKCSVCGLEQAVTDDSGNPVVEETYSLHQFISDPDLAYLDQQPECVGGNPGTAHLKCVHCGGTYIRTVPALQEHNFGPWKCVIAPGADGTSNGLWERTCTNYHCIEKQTYVGKTAPDGSSSTPSTQPTNTTSTQPTTPSSGNENYKVTSWNFSGSSVSGQIAGNVSYRTAGLSVNVIIYTPTGTFLATSAAVDENGQFSVSAGGAVYAVSIQLKDNNKVYQTEGKYV